MSKRMMILMFAVAGAACDQEVLSPLEQGGEEAAAELSSAASQQLGVEAAATATSAEAVRFLEQATFGPTPALLARVQRIGITAALEEQLSAPAGRFAATPPHAPPACDTPFPNATDLDAQFFTAAIEGADQLRLRTMFALSQILVVSANGIRENPRTCNSERRDAMQRYLNVLRRGAFGSYRALLEQIAVEPAMGNYLDMANNNAVDRDGNRVDPNENFARELMQLFTVGLNRLNEQGQVVRDAQGKALPVYDEADVEAFSRTLTGWTYPKAAATGDPCPSRGGKNTEEYSGVMIPCAVNHNAASAPLLRYAGAPLTATTAGASARVHLDEALDNLFGHPNLPPFVCTQLIHHLVTSNPSGAYVKRVVDVFKNDGAGHRGNLGAVVRAILLDPEARAPATLTRYGRLRAPAEFVARVVRALGGRLDATRDDPGGALNAFSARMGQDVPRPSSVFSYYQAQTDLIGPEFALLDTYSVTRRADFLHSLLFGDSLANRGVIVTLPANTATGALVSWADTNLLHGTMSTALRTTLTTVLDDGLLVNRQDTKRALAIYLTSLSPEFQIQR